MVVGTLDEGIEVKRGKCFLPGRHPCSQAFGPEHDGMSFVIGHELIKQVISEAPDWDPQFAAETIAKAIPTAPIKKALMAKTNPNNEKPLNIKSKITMTFPKQQREESQNPHRDIHLLLQVTGDQIKVYHRPSVSAAKTAGIA